MEAGEKNLIVNKYPLWLSTYVQISLHPHNHPTRMYTFHFIETLEPCTFELTPL